MCMFFIIRTGVASLRFNHNTKRVRKTKLTKDL
jgi:hypothetical protein